MCVNLWLAASLQQLTTPASVYSLRNIHEAAPWCHGLLVGEGQVCQKTRTSGGEAMAWR